MREPRSQAGAQCMRARSPTVVRTVRDQSPWFLAISQAKSANTTTTMARARIIDVSTPLEGKRSVKLDQTSCDLRGPAGGTVSV